MIIDMNIDNNNHAAVTLFLCLFIFGCKIKKKLE